MDIGDDNDVTENSNDIINEIYEDVHRFLNNDMLDSNKTNCNFVQCNEDDCKAFHQDTLPDLINASYSTSNSDTKDLKAGLFLSNSKPFVLFPALFSTISKNRFTISLRSYLYDLVMELSKRDNTGCEAVLDFLLKSKKKKRKYNPQQSSDIEKNKRVGHDAQYLLDNIFVLLPSHMQSSPRCCGFASFAKIGEQKSTQQDLVNQAISILFSRSHQLDKMLSKRKRVISVLLLGYQVLGDNSLNSNITNEKASTTIRNSHVETINELKSLPGIECRYPNSIISFLKKSGWETILKAIGDDLMLHLLIDVTLLIQIPNRCFVQLSGIPLSKDTFTESYTSSAVDASVKSKFDINRKSMMYCSSYRSKKSFPFLSKENILAKYLLVVKATVSNTKAREFVLELFKEENKKASSTAVKRLHPLLLNIVPYFKKMLHRLKNKCNIGSLLNHLCPVPKQELFETYRTENKALLLEVPHAQVSAFVKQVALRLIPSALWGNKKSRRFLLKRMSQFILRGANEVISIDQIMHGLPLHCFKWVQVIPKLNGKQIFDGLRKKQRCFLARFVYFLFNNVVIDLIRSNFYATEVEGCGHKIYYFRKEVWGKVLKHSFELQMKMRYKPADPEVIKKVSLERRYGWASIRSLPKIEGGLRYIVNLGSKPNGFKVSANAALNSAFQVLKYEVESTPSILSSSVSGLDDIFIKLSSFATKSKRFEGNNEKGNYYLVALDISKCFDTMIQDKTIDIISSVLRFEEYAISRYSVTYSDIGMECIRTRHVYKVTPSSTSSSWKAPYQSLQFIDQMRALVSSSESTKSSMISSLSMSTVEQLSKLKNRKCIFTDGVVKKYVEKKSILITLRDHICNNIVKFGQQLLIQTQGIPQGSIISTILCNIYFGKFEKEHLHFLKPGHLLMRLVDDFFLITKNKEEAANFVSYMHEGEPSYGMSVNPNKTRTSFALSNSFGKFWIPWCGLLINSKSLNVRIDYSRVLVMRLKDSFTPDIEVGKVNKSLKRLLRTTIGVKFHAIILDTKLNSKMNVIYNITQVFTLCALRYHQLLYSAYVFLNKYKIKPSSTIFTEFFDYAFALIHSRTIGRFKSCYFGIPFHVVKYIGSITFIRTLARMKKSHVLHRKSILILKSLSRSSSKEAEKSYQKQRNGGLCSLRLVLSTIKAANKHILDRLR